MRRDIRTIRFAIAMAALTAAGWTVGRAQSEVADFEITIDAPVGRVNVMCARGCQTGSSWMRTANAAVLRATFECHGGERCTGTVDGHGLVMKLTR